jgi:hypothetical protein
MEGNELNLQKYPPEVCAQDFITLRGIFNRTWSDSMCHSHFFCRVIDKHTYI